MAFWDGEKRPAIESDSDDPPFFNRRGKKKRITFCCKATVPVGSTWGAGIKAGISATSNSEKGKCLLQTRRGEPFGHHLPTVRSSPQPSESIPPLNRSDARRSLWHNQSCPRILSLGVVSSLRHLREFPYDRTMVLSHLRPRVWSGAVRRAAGNHRTGNSCCGG